MDHRSIRRGVGAYAYLHFEDGRNIPSLLVLSLSCMPAASRMIMPYVVVLWSRCKRFAVSLRPCE